MLEELVIHAFFTSLLICLHAERADWSTPVAAFPVVFRCISKNFASRLQRLKVSCEYDIERVIEQRGLPHSI